MIDCSKCSKRGCCCGIVPIPKEIAIKTQGLAQVKPDQVLEKEGKLYIITIDLLCVYLNRKNRKCMIYDMRPQICKDYGITLNLPCLYFKPNGEARDRLDKIRVEIQINNLVNKAISLVKENGCKI